MKVALICPSNILYMPYIKTYENILDEMNIEYELIIWDRFGIESDKSSYRDNKIGHQRNYFDYYKYTRYIVNQLNEKKYDKIVVFTLQLGYFLKKYLKKEYNNNYIFDIRDYNKIYKFHNFKTVISNSRFTTISSPGYKKWLPRAEKYVMNHNTNFSSLNKLNSVVETNVSEEIIISTIGVIRHWDINSDFVDSLANKKGYKLVFHGEGTINNRLKDYVVDSNFENVYISGRYKKEDEGTLYQNADLINTLLYNENINCRTLLTNRLYNSAWYGKPMLSLEGTYLAEQIKKYNLGLVLENLNDIDKKIEKYLVNFDIQLFNEGRFKFFEEVLKENDIFTKKLKEFILN